MSGNDEAGNRRVGDATRQRIDRLAEGWKVPKATPEPPTGAASPSPSALSDMPVDEKTPLPELDRASSVADVLEDDIISEERSDPGFSAVAAEIESTGPERNEDPTVLQDRDSSESGPVTSLRTPAALPRRRGLLGDVKYVFTALFGVARARRELAAVDRKLAKERADRKAELVVVAGEVVADPDCELVAVIEARAAIEGYVEQEERHGVAVSAAAAEIDGLEEEQSRRRVLHRDRLSDLEGQLASTVEELEPLDKAASRARKRATDLQVALDDLDARLASQESNVDSARDRATAEAALAATRSERTRTLAKQPELSAELTALEPRIAALTATREEITEKIAAARDAEGDATVRTTEKIEAIKAAMAVDERAVADAVRAREQALAELGDQLSLDRPDQLAPRLRGVDDFDLFIATLERRVLELREIVEGVNKVAVARGALVIALVVGAAAAATWFVLR